jgi:hypothetical protein
VRITKNHIIGFGRLMALVIAGLVLVKLSSQGFENAMRNTNDLRTLPQYLMTYSQFTYSALGFCVIGLKFISLQWMYFAWRAWVLFFIVTIATIPWAWIGPSFMQTLSFGVAGVAAASLLSLLIVFGAQPKQAKSEARSDA